MLEFFHRHAYLMGVVVAFAIPLAILVLAYLECLKYPAED